MVRKGRIFCPALRFFWEAIRSDAAALRGEPPATIAGVNWCGDASLLYPGQDEPPVLAVQKTSRTGFDSIEVWAHRGHYVVFTAADLSLSHLRGSFEPDELQALPANLSVRARTRCRQRTGCPSVIGNDGSLVRRRETGLRSGSAVNFGKPKLNPKPKP